MIILWVVVGIVVIAVFVAVIAMVVKAGKEKKLGPDKPSDDIRE